MAYTLASMGARARVTTLSGVYDGRSIDRLVDGLGSALEAEAPSTWRVDLSAMTFVKPTALAVASAAFERMAARGIDVEVVLPDDPDCRRYVQRMDMLPAAWHVADEGFRRHPPSTFCPVHRFTDERDYPGARRGLVGAIERMCDLDEPTRDALALCLDELCENVVHHACVSAPAVAVAQAWPARRMLEVAIADLGRGVPASLAANEAYASIPDHVEAVRQAFRFGVTATPERNAGMGLAVTQQLMRSNGGVVGIRSGFAAVMRGGTHSEELRTASFPGTMIVLDIRTDRPLDLTRAYAEMENGDDA